MYDVKDIANWFLIYNLFMETDQGADGISNLKLQKLLYYAQSAFLALKNELLFSNEIVAWQHGPVIEEIYHKYKDFGSGDIEVNIENGPQIDKETEKILMNVYDTFGEYSAWGIRNLTHSEKPWLETPLNKVISTETMKESFKENYVEN